MKQRYLIEKKKGGAADFYLVRIVEGETMREAAHAVEGEFMPHDQLRISLLSVSLVATLGETRDWQVAKLL